jgi:hypothetical protein
MKLGNLETWKLRQEPQIKQGHLPHFRGETERGVKGKRLGNRK